MATLRLCIFSLAAIFSMVPPIGPAALAARSPAKDGAKAPPRGRLDFGFGTNGRVVGPASTYRDGVARAAVGPDGAIAVALGETISRYLPNGELDPGFGIGGTIPVPSPGPSGPNPGPPRPFFRLAAIALDAEDRLLVAGTTLQPESMYLRGPGFTAVQNPSLVTVYRYLASGVLDPNFGQDGIVMTEFGLPPGFNYEVPAQTYDRPSPQTTSMAVDAAGRIILGGTYTTAVYPHCKWEAVATTGAFVGRLTPDGSPDLSFAGTGRVTVSDLVYYGAAAATDRAGNVVLAAAHPKGFFCGFPTPEERSGSVSAFRRFFSSGASDARFSENGVLHIGGGASRIAVDGTGRILALLPRASSVGKPLQVIRLKSNGALDRSFGEKGHVAVPSGFTAVAPGGRGRVLLAGEGLASRFVLMRLLFTGVPDRAVGRGGRVDAGFGQGIARPDALLVDARGRPTLVGVLLLTGVPPEAEATLAMARFLLPR